MIRIIESQHETNDGRIIEKLDRQLLLELVSAYNDLAEHVALQSGMVKEKWSSNYVEND